MTLFVLGLNHQKTPIDIRERLAFTEPQLSAEIAALRERLGASELVLLSTCNRTELYMNHEQPEDARREALAALQSRARHGDLAPYHYAHEGDEGIRHLFRVASGLDSMVLGENEVLGQVKNAYLGAQKHGCTGKLLNVLFQRSLYVGKRVRTETGLAMGAGSVGSVAVSMAERIFGSLKEQTVLILGAGKMAELTARHLLSQKVAKIVVANRTYARAQQLAGDLGGEAIPFDQTFERMTTADIVICSTAATEPIIQPSQIGPIMERRKGRSLFFVDIAVPRDVHPDVHQLDNVYVYNIDDLQAIVQENVKKRAQEVRAAEAIVDEKVKEFGGWFAAYLNGKDHALQHGPSESDSNSQRYSSK